MAPDSSYTQQRMHMVREQIIARGVHDPRVLEAMRQVPRHCFVPREFRAMAYNDGPLPIGQGQTISQPYIVALMSEMMELHGDETVLEIGTGSGYQAAVLAQLAKTVHTVERHAALAEHAEQVLQALEVRNVAVHVGDGTLGLLQYAPYQAIMVTAASPGVPEPLLEQLADGGRLVIPVGSHGSQILERWSHQGTAYHQEKILPVAFVPLRGAHGWKD